MTNAVLTVGEVAARWRVSRMTVYRLVHDGVLPSLLVGRSIRIRVDDVHRYESQPPQWRDLA